MKAISLLFISLMLISTHLLAKQIPQEKSVSFKVYGKGSPIILLPGFLSNGDVWATTVNALQNRHQIHVASVAGFGGSPAVSDTSIDKIHRDIVQYITQQKLPKTIIFGHSMGAFLSYKLAISHPELIEKIVAIDGLPFLTPIFTRTNDTQVADAIPFAEQLKHQYHNMNADQLAQITRQGVFIQAQSTLDQERIIQMATKSDPVTAGNIMYDLMTTDLRGKLENVETPILLLGASGAFQANGQKQFADKLYRQQIQHAKNVTLIMNTNARHFIMFDDLSWLLAQIDNFI